MGNNYSTLTEAKLSNDDSSDQNDQNISNTTDTTIRDLEVNIKKKQEQQVVSPVFSSNPGPTVAPARDQSSRNRMIFAFNVYVG